MGHPAGAATVTDFCETCGAPRYADRDACPDCGTQYPPLEEPLGPYEDWDFDCEREDAYRATTAMPRTATPNLARPQQNARYVYKYGG